MNECIEAATQWEGFLGGAVFGAVVVFAWLSKKAKDSLTTSYEIKERQPDGSTQRVKRVK